jgi:hypothetical protein
VKNPERKSPLGRPRLRLRRENNIKIYLTSVGRVECTDQALDKSK